MLFPSVESTTGSSPQFVTTTLFATHTEGFFEHLELLQQPPQGAGNTQTAQDALTTWQPVSAEIRQYLAKIRDRRARIEIHAPSNKS